MEIKHTNVTINVKDLDHSIAFYESIGFTLKERWQNHYAQISAPGIEIGLHPTSKSSMHRNSGNVSIGFTASDFNQVRTRLDELGISIKNRKEEGGEFLHFEDPDGTSLYFIQPKF